MKDRVLFVTFLDPFQSGGGPQATRAFMDATIEIFGRNKVDIMACEGIAIPKDYQDINFIFVPQRPKWLAYLLFPFGILGRFAKPLAKCVNGKNSVYDYCIINGCMEAGHCFKNAKSSKVKKIVIHHNMEVKFNMDNKTILTLKGRWPYTLRQAEKNAYKYADYNLFLTQQDLSEMEGTYGNTNAKNRLIGTFDYKDADIIRPDKSEKHFHLVASGTMGHNQTKHGVLDFYNRYYPIAKRMKPELKILLTGRNPSKEISDLENATQYSIRVVPNPKDIMAEVQMGCVYLCPTDIGSGLKLRAMDGLKCGLPILVHEVSARGYDFFYDKPYYRIYHDEKTFEKGLKDILYFLEVTPNPAQIINHDYYQFFGFAKGVERFKAALE